MQHLPNIRTAIVHQNLDVSGNAARNGPQCQQILVRIVWLVVTQYLAHRSRRERLQPDRAVITTKQRLLLILEDLLHHTEDATRHHQANVGLLLISIPQFLHIAEHLSIYVVKLLELVDEQREPTSFANLEKEMHQFAEGSNTFRYIFIQLGANLLAECPQQRSLRLSAHEEVNLS